MRKNGTVFEKDRLKPSARPASTRRLGLALAVILTSAVAPAQESAEPGSWQLVNPRPVTADLLGAAHGNGVFVFVGRGGTILTSPEGVSWESRDSGASQDLHDVVWTGEAFVAVGAGGTVSRSENGVDWVSEAATTRRLVAVAAGPVLVAVGPGGWIYSSPDGIVWTAADSGTEADLVDVAWTGSEFLVVGDLPEILASPDGRSWTARASLHDGPFSCVASNGSTTVVVEEGGRAWAIGDQNEWTWAEAASSLTAVDWTGEEFIGVRGNGYRLPVVSSDGVRWSYGRVTAPGLRLRALASGGGVVVGGGVGGVLAVSRDGGQHFKPVNTFTGLDLYGLAVKNGVWVAAAGTPDAWHGSLFASSDGANWEITYDMGLEALYDVAGNDSVFVAVGVINELWSGGAIIRRSSDGRTWYSSSGSTGDGDWPWEWRTVAWDGARFVAAGTGGAVATSSDAFVWHLIGGSEITDHTFFGAASDGVTLVAVGRTGVIAVSHDGETLAVVHPGYEEGDLFDAAWGNGIFVAVGSDGGIQTSSDGDQWQERSSGTSSDLFGVRFTGDGFVALGRDGVVLTSTDGASWQAAGSAGDVNLNDVLQDGATLTAVGDDGVVVRSAPSEPSLPPVPGFSWRPPSPETGVPVRFVDLSEGEPTSWRWDFGDGGSAAGSEATHIFNETGSWPVSLTVGNDNGTAAIETVVEVRPFCGASPAATVSAPTVADSGEDYEISWTETLEPWEEGHYIVYEAANPDFVKAGAVVVRDAVSTVRRHSWSEAGSYFYRIVSRNNCPDGIYYSEPSNTVRVDIEPEVSDLGEHVRVVTAAAHGAGMKSTEWVTDVTVHNPGPYAAPLHLFLLPRVGEGEPAGGPRRWVEPGQSLLIEDAVADLASPGTGALLVASDRPLVVGTRTFNDGTNGSFGQYIAGESEGRVSEEGGRARLVQLMRNDDFRTNLALANAGAGAAELTISLFGADGRPLGTVEESLPGLSSAFLTDILDDLTENDADDAFAVIEADDEADKWTAMASLVDNRTGDPSTLPALTGQLQHRILIDDDVPLIRDWEWRDILFAEDIYVAAGWREMAWSTDGMSWHRGDFPGEAPDIWKLAWNGSGFLASGFDGVLISDDGRSWSSVDLPQGRWFNAIAWDGSQWLGAGSDGSDGTVIGLSADGLNWDWHGVEDMRLRAVAWAGDRFVAGMAQGFATSVDGVTWSVVDEVDDWINELAWNGRELVGVGIHGLHVSTDLTTFSTIDFGREPTSVVWAGDRWVVGAGGIADAPGDVLLVSFDLSTWEMVPLPGPVVNAVYGMAWDGSTVLAVDFARRLTWLVGDGPEVTVPAVAHLGGRGGSRWRSDVELHNPGSGSVDCVLELVKRGENGLDPEWAGVSIGAGSSVRIPDLVADRFGGPGVGALTVRPADGEVLVSSRTFADDPTGSYGQMVPGLRATDAIHGFESGRLIQLRHSPRPTSGYRTNLGFVARCSEEMEVEVHLYRGSGVLMGVETVTLPPMGNAQLNNVFAPFTDDVISDGFAVLSSSTPRCSFHAYASVVDNRTHDPILVPVAVWNPDPD